MSDPTAPPTRRARVLLYVGLIVVVAIVGIGWWVQRVAATRSANISAGV